MGLDMYLSKINRKVSDMKELQDCIRIINEQATRKTLARLLDDYSKMSLPEFLEKNRYYGLLKKYNDSLNKPIIDKLFEKPVEEEVKEMMADARKEFFSILEVETNLEITEVCYWRKHSDLNGLMQDLYYDRGGEDEFNCKNLLLSKEDVVDLIERHKEHLDGEDEIPHTPGFFWGQTDREDWENSLQDFEKVLKETDWDNESVYYSCWW